MACADGEQGVHRGVGAARQALQTEGGEP